MKNERWPPGDIFLRDIEHKSCFWLHGNLHLRCDDNPNSIRVTCVNLDKATVCTYDDSTLVKEDTEAKIS